MEFGVLASLGTNLPMAIAFNRFGLGGRPDDTVPASASAWLLGQLNGPDTATAGLPGTAAGLRLLLAWRSATTPATAAPAAAAIAQLFASETQALLANAITTTTPFRERLVWFWSNHFALMASTNPVSCCAGAYVREAIRPNVTGTFKDMLLAVMQHPAMLASLDNTASAGPQSPAVQQCQATGCTTLGINENLARECLELHTLGVTAGYTQADVDALAMLITGWSVHTSGAPFGFTFNNAMHQPGSQTLLGQTFPGTQAGGIAALGFLATHPLTYQHLATQLVTHFVSDTPTAADIATVAQALSATGGNLASAASAVVGLPSAWQPGTKMRAPIDYLVAVFRAAGGAPAAAGTSAGITVATSPPAALGILGAPLLQPPFPNGYSDLTADWAGPAQMLLRADWINALCSSLGGTDVAAACAMGLGPLLTPATAAAIAAAGTTHDKLSLLFLSPEFQRR